MANELYGFKKNLEKVQVRSKSESAAKSHIVPTVISTTAIAAPATRYEYNDLVINELANWNVVVLRCTCVNVTQNLICFRGANTQNNLSDYSSDIKMTGGYYVDWASNRIRVRWIEGRQELAQSNVKILAVYGLVQNVGVVDPDTEDESTPDEGEDIDISTLTEEVLGIRIGADGVVYDTAGQAVREQYNKLAEQLDALNAEDVIQQINEAIGAIPTEVNEWLDNHPEATTTVEDGSLTEQKFTDSLKLATLKDYVTPEMFGAVGDGVADDTNAVQEAINSEKNVCLVGKYRITDTLIFNKAGQWGKNIFALTEVRWSTQCQLFFDMADRTKPCIELQSDGFTMQNVSVRGVGDRNLTFIKTNITAVDVDMSFLSCSIYNFDTIVNITGRGLDMSNCVVAGCSVIAKIAWKTEREDAYHNDDTGQRAYNFCNNRFHSMSAATKPMIQVASGNVYGFRFVNNNFDRGYSSMILAEGNIKDWIITGNTFNGMMGYGSNLSFMTFNGNVEQLTISDNMFTQVERNTLTDYVIKIIGTTNNFIFANNSFSEIKNATLIYFGDNVINSVLSNNVLQKNVLMSTSRGLFFIVNSKTIESTTIIGNVVGENTSTEGNSYNQWILRCAGALTLRNVKMIGNVKPYSNTTARDYSIGTPTIESCMFDWLFAVSS